MEKNCRNCKNYTGDRDEGIGYRYVLDDKCDVSDGVKEYRSLSSIYENPGTFACKLWTQVESEEVVNE